ncbi:hypothetical protein [Nonomuraea sp. PA05]|uniref:hypothetical protein n=1 Tax=Nonomuraea sp. PA05 TaxID=2604466 RepID=UPI001CA32F62|nr:hypothetical protein [Nonomuraea sp. PA05]
MRMASPRRKWIIGRLPAERTPAAEVRASTMRGFLLRMYDAVARAEQDVMLTLALGGLGTALVYADLYTLQATAYR